MKILEMKQVGRHYYDPTNPSIVPQHKWVQVFRFQESFSQIVRTEELLILVIRESGSLATN